MPEIDRLEVQVEAKARNANRQLDTMEKKLDAIADSLSRINTSGLAGFANSIGKLGRQASSLRNIHKSDFTTIASGLKSISDVDSSKLNHTTSAINILGKSIGSLGAASSNSKQIASVLRPLSALMKADTSKFDGAGLNSAVKSIESLAGIPDISRNVNNSVNAIRRLASTDMSKFDSSAFAGIPQVMQELASIPDISSRLNRFVASVASLARSGGSIPNVVSNIPALSGVLRSMVGSLSVAPAVSSGTDSIVASIARLASAGKRTGQTAAQMDSLADSTIRFFNRMQAAPQISENTIRMAQALGQLASAGGRVNSATNTVTSAFTRLHGIGRSAAGGIAGASKKIILAITSIGNSSGHLHKASLGFGNLLRSALPFLSVYQLFDFGKKSIELASDLTEVQNVVDSTFGNMSSKVEEMSKTSIQDFGMSELTVKQISSRFQAMGVAMGLVGEKGADMSINLTKLSGDMASFYNDSHADISKAMQSIYTGETEPLRRYGLDLSQATLQEWAAKQGIDAKIGSMTQAQKTMLRYQYVMANTTVAQGDFARTSGTWANQVRILSESFKSLGAIIGGVAINAFKPFISALNSVMQSVISAAQTIADALGAIFGWTIEIGGGSAMEDVSEGLGDIGSAGNGAAGGLGNAAGKANELKRALMGFDQINKLPDDIESAESGSGGSGGGAGAGAGAGDGLTAELVRTDSVLDKFESEIGTLEQLGSYIGTALTNAMRNIPWSEVYSQANGFGTGLADFLNGLISPELFGQLGSTVSGAINTALHGLNSFGITFEWDGFGNSIKVGINRHLATIDFKLAESTAMVWGQGIATSLNAVMTPTTFIKVGSAVASAFNTAVSGAYSFIGTINWRGWGDAIAQGMNRFFRKFDFNKLGQSLNGFVTGVLDTMISWIEKTDWDSAGEKIGEFLSGLDFTDIASKVGELFWAAINAAIKTWKGMFDAAPVETAIISALALLKFTGLGSIIGNAILQQITQWATGNAAKIGMSTFASTFSTKLATAIATSLKSATVIGLIGAGVALIIKGINDMLNDPNFLENQGVEKYITANPGSLGEGAETPERDAEVEYTLPVKVVPKFEDMIVDELNKSLPSETSVDVNLSAKKIQIPKKLKSLRDFEFGAKKIFPLANTKMLGVEAEVSKLESAKNIGSLENTTIEVGKMEKSRTFSNTLPGVIAQFSKWSKALGFNDKVTNLFGELKSWVTGDKWSNTVTGMTAQFDWRTTPFTSTQEGKTVTGMQAQFDWRTTPFTSTSEGKAIPGMIAQIDGKTTPFMNTKEGKTVTGMNAQFDTSTIKFAKTVDEMKALFTSTDDSGIKNKTINNVIAKLKKMSTTALNSGDKTISGIIARITSLSSGKQGLSLYGIAATVSRLTTASSFAGLTLTAVFKVLTSGLQLLFRAGGGVFANGHWSPITAYAGGGSPASGQMFIAREAGPELVGTLGGHTAVMNNDQIVASVSAGVYQAVAAAMAQFSGNSSTPVINVYIGDRQITDVVIKDVNNRTISTGQCPILT